MDEEEKALLKACAAAPDDDLPRLVLADWYEEHSDPDRAFYIRAMCTPTATDSTKEQAKALWAEHLADWGDSLVPLGAPAHRTDYERGLITGVTVSLQDFLDHGEQLLDRMPTLRSLRVKAYSLLPRTTDTASGDAGLRTLVQCPSLGHFSELDVSTNGVGRSGVESLVRSPHTRKLTTLRLDGNALGDGGVRALAGSRLLSRLSSLSLRLNHIGDDGVIALTTTPYLRQVRTLDLWLNPIGIAGMDALQRSRHIHPDAWIAAGGFEGSHRDFRGWWDQHRAGHPRRGSGGGLDLF